MAQEPQGMNYVKFEVRIRKLVAPICRLVVILIYFSRRGRIMEMRQPIDVHSMCSAIFIIYHNSALNDGNRHDTGA